MNLIGYDVTAVRAHFPALAEGAAHFDGPGGSQVPDVVGAAVAGTLTAAVANRGAVTAAERRAEAAVRGARQAVADLLGGTPDGVVFGRSMTQLTYDFARALAKGWRAGDEVVVTRLDHDANIRPWVQAAAASGVTVRWVPFDRETGELPVAAVEAELSERTRLVAVTAAGNLLGTRPDVPAIAAAAHRAGALCYVDGVHLTPHAPVDVTALGADLYACSPYKFLGPHLGTLVAAPELLEGIHPDKLLPASDAVPERFELGTLPYELLAGTTAAVDFLAGLAGEGAAAAVDGRAGGVRGRAGPADGGRPRLHRRRHPLRPGRPADPDGAVHPGGQGAHRGVPGARRGGGERAGRQLLRHRVRALARPGRHRRRARRHRPLHQRVRCGQAGDRGGRAGEALADVDLAGQRDRQVAQGQVLGGRV
jgi:cysteine desulfurase family protein (TIGR01976 family)